MKYRCLKVLFLYYFIIGSLNKVLLLIRISHLLGKVNEQKEEMIELQAEAEIAD